MLHDIPRVPGKGSWLGEFCIAAGTAGIFRGDGRGFDAAPNPNRSRASFDLDFERGKAIVEVNYTCTAVGACVSAYPFGEGNTANITIENNILNLTGSFRNPAVGSGPITVNLSMAVGPGSAFSLSITPFPSFELTKTVGGVTSVLVRSPEASVGFWCLTGVCGMRTFP